MICAVVTAAGRSRRMGTQKLLLPFGGTTVIGHVVDELLRSVLDEVYVVVGHQPERITAELSGRAVSIVTNTDYDRGMLSSVRCGLGALKPECEVILVALGDQPAVTAELVDAMAESFATVKQRIVVPVHRGRRGHPLLFSAEYRQEILTGHDDLGLRGLLCAHPDDVFELPVPSAGVLSDIDCPEDYRRQRASLERNTPT
ncbi:MAG: nucleotidyltransferase family protein, partial [Planctomycetota bacterium]